MPFLGYDNEKNDGYNKYEGNKERDYKSAVDTSFGEDEDQSSGYLKGKGKNYGESSYGSERGKGDSPFPQLSGSYDGEQDDWQSGGSYNPHQAKGPKYSIEDSSSLSSYSSDDDSDDSDSYKTDTDSVKASLGGYGSLKDYEMKDYSSMFSGTQLAGIFLSPAEILRLVILNSELALFISPKG